MALVRTTCTDKKRELYTWGFNEMRATGHPVEASIDIYRPTLLDLTEIGDEKMDYVHVTGLSAGSAHSLLLVNCYRK